MHLHQDLQKHRDRLCTPSRQATKQKKMQAAYAIKRQPSFRPTCCWLPKTVVLPSIAHGGPSICGCLRETDICGAAVKQPQHAAHLWVHARTHIRSRTTPRHAPATLRSGQVRGACTAPSSAPFLEAKPGCPTSCTRPCPCLLTFNRVQAHRTRARAGGGRKHMLSASASVWEEHPKDQARHMASYFWRTLRGDKVALAPGFKHGCCRACWRTLATCLMRIPVLSLSTLDPASRAPF